MNPLSRRTFLARGSLAAVIASAAAAVPGLGAVMKMPTTQAAFGAQPPMTGPLIAHIRDVKSGEIALMYGPDKVIHRDADLAARLYEAARRA